MYFIDYVGSYYCPALNSLSKIQKKNVATSPAPPPPAKNCTWSISEQWNP